MAPSAPILILGGAAVALVALGLLVWVVRPRVRAAQVLGATCIGYGLSYAAIALAGGMEYGEVPPAPLQALAIVGVLLLAPGAIGLALIVPAPIERRLRRRIVLAAALPALVIGALLLWTGPAYGIDAAHQLIANTVWNVALFFTFFALPLRFLTSAPGDALPRRTFALLAAGFALFIAGQGGDLVLAIGLGPTAVALDATYTLLLLAASPVWLYAASRGRDARHARNVAILIPAALLGGMLVGGGAREAAYAPGLLAGALVLVYAVLRGQIAGLDVKIRFALSKSTIAAIFIAVFFIASEAAQQFFGETLNSAYLGILAAGALVFALAPLSRLADRLAEKAVPASDPGVGPGPGPGAASSGKEQAYRTALRVALRDRVLTREEEIGLAHLSDELGLSHKRAREIWHEVEREGQHDGEGAAR